MPAAEPDPGEITLLLRVWGAGDRSAYERLFPIVYAQLRALAEREFRRESPGHTLQPTAIVHEAYVELLGQRDPRFENRRHFLAVAAFVMRRLVASNACLLCDGFDGTTDFARWSDHQP